MVATVSAYSSSASDVAQNSDSSRSTTAHALYMLRIPTGLPPALHYDSTTGWVQQKLGTKSAVRDKGDFHPMLCLSQARQTIVGASTGSKMEIASTSVCS